MTDDLLDSIDSDSTAGVVDLLDGLGEGSDAEAWMPTEAGQGVQGTVVAVGATTSEYTTDPIPVVTVETSAGQKVRITAYQSVLRREIEEVNPQRGDLFAVKYLGKKSTKDGKREFHAYKAAARRGSGARPQPGAGKPPF
jgi:hypothetical protein